MARIRTVKPELFLDEELGALSGDHLALFVGLWTQADREGRLEDRPVRLKAALFPYRPIDIEALLNGLVGIGKIVRYEVGGVQCIAIPGFLEHQRPHPKEPPSKLPSPPGAVKKHGEPWKETAGREKPGSIPSSPVGREGDLGREGKEAASPPPPSQPPEPTPISPALVFFAWSQEVRAERFPGVFPQNRPAGYDGWYERALRELGGDEARLRGTWRAFVADDTWAPKLQPVAAFNAFIGKDSWRKYVPAAAAPEPPKRAWVPVAKAVNG